MDQNHFCHVQVILGLTFQNHSRTYPKCSFYQSFRQHFLSLENEWARYSYVGLLSSTFPLSNRIYFVLVHGTSQAVSSGTKVRSTLRKYTALASSSHSQLGKDIDSTASEAAPNTSKSTSFRSAVHVEASDNSSSPSANQEFLPESVAETENKRRKDKAKEKEPNVQKSRVSENVRTSKQGVEGRQKVWARRSMNLTGRRDIKGVAGSGMGRFAVGVTS